MRMILALLLALAVHPAFAQAPSSASGVLIVDLKRVMDESTASVSVQKKIETRRSAFQGEIADREKSIRDAADELQQLRGKIDAKDYAEKENALRKQFSEVEQYVQERRRVLEQATTNSMGRVKDVMMKIVADIAHKRGAQAVLSKQQAIWSEGAIDVTDQVLSRLNSELPDVEVAIEPAASAPEKPAQKPK